jgi:large subunit ribosomal protein L21
MATIGAVAFLDIARRDRHKPRTGRVFWPAALFSAVLPAKTTHNPTVKKPVRTLRAPGSNARQKMFAVIKTGGKQYRVAPDDELKVARLEGEPGTIVELTDVLMVGGETPVLGNPVPGASVAAEVVEHGRGSKVIAFKKRRRKNSRRRRGFREEFTLIRITEILTDGKKPSQQAKAERKRKPKPAKEDSAPAADATAPPEA